MRGNSKPTGKKPDMAPRGQGNDVPFPPGISNYGSCNMAFTSSNGTQAKLDLSTLLKVMGSIPKRPRIFTMDIKLLEHSLLDGNTILISSDIAKALEEAMGESNGS